MEKKIIHLPKGFFEIERPIISFEESLKDVIPVKWKEHKKDKKKNKKKNYKI